ncbi:hypothetical protein IWQ57_004564, partial [Coemansia nantahalensis]
MSSRSTARALPLPRSGRWSWPSKTFLAITAVQTATNLALEACLMAYICWGSFTPAQSLIYLVYGGGCIAAQVAALLLAAVALHARSAPLVVTSTALDMLLVALRSALLVQVGAYDRVVAMQAAGIGALAVGCATKAFLALRHLRREFGWQVYRALGDDPKMQRMFLHRQLLFVLVVLAGFSFFQVWLLRAAAAALAGPRAIGWVEIAVTAVVCMATLCVTLSAAVHEAAWSMYACVGVYACAPAYIVYKLVVAATGQHLDRSEVSAHNASSRCMIVLLGALLVLDAALALVSLVVARGFGRGLRQQLRHFHTLSRSPVDLESGVYVGHDADSPSRPSPDGQGQADHASSGTGPSQRTVGSVLSWMAANTKESVRESWLLFRAFFCGLGVADEPEATETGEAAETAEIADTPSTQPTLQLYHSMPKFSAMALHDIFGPACSASLQGSQDLSAAGECRRSSESTECGSLCFGDMSVSDPDLPRLGSYGSFHPDARPDTPVTLELLLSIEELNTINGELAVAASASTINRSFVGG